ncbi:MAG: hypothetical protein KatS3mg077_1889 [Candidatus Binatia bacterium]|nr:MAG: hypothetical protein KatS3mg077_1889 [Candidatus Binatia bacterium]
MDPNDRKDWLKSLLVAQYVPGQRRGHYESFFFRANHPQRPQAFWIRYTLFSPHRNPEQAIGELWGIWFDGESQQHVAVKKEVPIQKCRFSRQAFEVHIGDAHCREGALEGEAESADGRMRWHLTYSGSEPPLLLLPQAAYRARLPRAKSLVGLPLARFAGWIEVAGKTYEIAEWVGSQNHNWGSRHTDSYAWGQVAGFDNAPESFLEVATARLKLGGLWTPPFTPLVLRHGGQEYALTRTMDTVRAQGAWDFFRWTFATGNEEVQITGKIEAPASMFVALRYYNPPGGEKYCLNSKLACCELTVHDLHRGTTEVLRTAHRAAFEILTDRTDHGLPVRV